MGTPIPTREAVLLFGRLMPKHVILDSG